MKNQLNPEKFTRHGLNKQKNYFMLVNKRLNCGSPS